MIFDEDLTTLKMADTFFCPEIMIFLDDRIQMSQEFKFLLRKKLLNIIIKNRFDSDINKIYDYVGYSGFSEAVEHLLKLNKMSKISLIQHHDIYEYAYEHSSDDYIKIIKLLFDNILNTVDSGVYFFRYNNNYDTKITCGSGFRLKMLPTLDNKMMMLNISDDSFINDELIKACEYGLNHLVDFFMLKKKINDEERIQLLKIACRNNNLTLVEYLRKKLTCDFLLRYACENSYSELLIGIIQLGSVKIPSNLIIDACSKGHMVILKILIFSLKIISDDLVLEMFKTAYSNDKLDVFEFLINYLKKSDRSFILFGKQIMNYIMDITNIVDTDHINLDIILLVSSSICHETDSSLCQKMIQFAIKHDCEKLLNHIIKLNPTITNITNIFGDCLKLSKSVDITQILLNHTKIDKNILIWSLDSYLVCQLIIKKYGIKIYRGIDYYQKIKNNYALSKLFFRTPQEIFILNSINGKIQKCNFYNFDNNYAIECAIINGHHHLVSHLLDQVVLKIIKSCVIIKSYSDYLKLAFKSGHQKVIKTLLLDKRFDFNFKLYDWNEEFDELCRHGLIKYVKFLRPYVDIQERHLISAYGNYNLMKYLLKYHNNYVPGENLLNLIKQNPLKNILSLFPQTLEIAEICCKYFEDPETIINMTDNYYNSDLLDLACKYSRVNMAKKLISKNIFSPNAYLLTTNIEILNMLLHNIYFDLSLLDNIDKVFIKAIKNCNVEIVQTLILSGFLINIDINKILNKLINNPARNSLWNNSDTNMNYAIILSNIICHPNFRVEYIQYDVYVHLIHHAHQTKCVELINNIANIIC